MPSAAHLRKQLEDALSVKAPAALSPRLRTEAERLCCGVGPLDGLLRGGLAVGVLTELVGMECSGRTTMALAYAAATIRAGSVCAWVDVADGLDPESAAANGVDLERLLWIRCGGQSKSLTNPGPAPVQATDGLRQSLTVLSAAPSSPAPRHTGGGSPHPRSEGRDMPEAIRSMLHAHGGLQDRQVRRHKQAIGTPGAPNRPLDQRSGDREEQADSSRQPARRGENLATASRPAVLQPGLAHGLSPALPSPALPSPALPSPARSGPARSSPPQKPWAALDQALRTADLLLQGGGFSMIVLDLGRTPPEAAWRIPLATWFRFRAACERTRASLLLLTQHPCARSSAELVVRLEPGTLQAAGCVVTGVRYQGEAERTRFHPESRVVPIRKPPQPERPGQWKVAAAWAQSR